MKTKIKKRQKIIIENNQKINPIRIGKGMNSNND